MTRVASFFNDRRGLAAIDYVFVALLVYALRGVALEHGAAAGLLVRRALHLS